MDHAEWMSTIDDPTLGVGGGEVLIPTGMV